MTQSNKYAARKPFTPKPVVYTAWGLLLAALVMHFVPALETVALILYAVGLIALCVLALTAPKKGTLAVPRVFLPMLAAAFLILDCAFGMRPDESSLVWRSILLALILLIPLLMAEKQAAADIDRGRFAARVFIVVGVLWMTCAFWLVATNSVFDADVGMSHISTVTQMRTEGDSCHMDVVWDGRTLDFPVSKEDFSEIAAGDKVLVTAYDGFWGAPYYTWEIPQSP
jgi:membrane protein